MALTRLQRALRNYIRRVFFRDPFLLEVRRWFRDKGDDTLRLNYPLERNSTVLDVGGYQGDFTAAIHARYGCRVFIFEPIPNFYESCTERFSKVPEVVCLNYGLGEKDGIFNITDAGDASSFIRSSENMSALSAQIRGIANVWHELDLGTVSLMKINIEGGEYDLLTALIDSGLVQKVKHLQIQFHNFVDNAIERRQLIRQRLSNTHEEMWNYEFVWEGWRRK